MSSRSVEAKDDKKQGKYQRKEMERGKLRMFVIVGSMLSS
jgi:predicted nucleic acid-binding Zn finger protein